MPGRFGGISESPAASTQVSASCLSRTVHIALCFALSHFICLVRMACCTVPELDWRSLRGLHVNQSWQHQKKTES